jgi:hypothetical protein
MNYQNLVSDFAFRTRQNLETLMALQAKNPEAQVYEVTQLINSMLGLLVLPQQRYFNRIPAIPLAELAEQGWPMPRLISVSAQDQKVEDLRELMRYLRNGIAHFNLEFSTDRQNNINGLYLWNTRAGRVTWKVHLSLEDLKLITEKFIEILLKEEP